jgi:hypothetical protein
MHADALAGGDATGDVEIEGITITEKVLFAGPECGANPQKERQQSDNYQQALERKSNSLAE